MVRAGQCSIRRHLTFVLNIYRLFAIFGALLLIIIQGVGPYAQQVVRLETRAISTSAAALPTAEIYDTYDTHPDDNPGDVSPSMKAAIQRGILDINVKPSTFFANPQCPTGNCTWPPYTSLSVCGRCSDVSSLLTVANINEGHVTPHRCQTIFR